MALMRTGRVDEATADLRAAFDGGAKDAEMPNALAFELLRRGDASEAAAVLRRAVADHPDSVTLEHNLARLLATSSDPRVRDGAAALRLALDVCEKTGSRDPRALDTLAAAYAATGRIDLARATAERAADRARESGDPATAAEIAAHAGGYARQLTTSGALRR
jgi:Flp pilus assembly protein TadD